MNAQRELLDFIQDKPEVVCLTFAQDVNYQEGPYTTGTLEEILPLLDFEYDAGF